MLYGLKNMFVICCIYLLVGCSLTNISILSTAVDFATFAPVSVAIETGELPLELITTSEVNSSARTREHEKMRELKKCILRHWIHSHEEDTKDVAVYRPVDYNFPPSRGRVGFEFMEDGNLIYYGIGYADGSNQSSGHWVAEGQNRIRINVENERMQPFELEVVSCDEEALKVRR
jgi:hypothetical protein